MARLYSSQEKQAQSVFSFVVSYACLILHLINPINGWWTGFAATLVIGSGLAVAFYSHMEQKERSRGYNRRTDPQVHSDPHLTISAGAVFVSNGDGTWRFAGNDDPEFNTTLVAVAVAVPIAVPRAVPRTGIVLGEVVGYRAWPLRGPILESFNGTIWLPGNPVEGLGLDENNSAGVHAFKTYEQALRYADDGLSGDPLTAVGRVKLWGEIVEHADGWRGEHAMPAEIIDIIGIGVDGDDDPDGAKVAKEIILRTVRRLYGLDGS